MRALVLLLLLLPAVAAQPPVPLVEVEAEDPPLVRPLQGNVLSNVTTRVSCALVDGARGVPISYQVADAPAWVTVVVSPSSDVADATACDAGFVTRNASLLFTANDQAPAFQPAAVTLLVTAGPEGRREEARTDVAVAADYFSVLDVQQAESTRTAAPDSAAPFTVRLTNLGNARTRVTFTVENATGDLVVDPVPPVTLQSRQQGDPQISTDVTLVAHTPPGGLFMNAVATFTVLAQAEHAGDPARRGDSTRLTFVVNVRSGAGDQDAPLPALLAVVGLALASAAKRGLRR